MTEQATSNLEELAARAVREAYNRGRFLVYGELIDECVSDSRTKVAIWLMEKYGAPENSPEQLAYVEQLRERLEVLKGGGSG